jgi:DnaJ like chaperone protein
MAEYHPDKVAQLGEELRILAEAKSKEINAAYSEALRVCDSR